MFSKCYELIVFVGVVWIFRMGSGEYLGTPCINENCASNNSTRENGASARVLSRSKRYLVFPDGSSLQLVFCCQTAALIPIGDIFLFGSTAALSWNLPTDPNFLLMLKDKGQNAQRRGDDTKSVAFVNEGGKIVSKFPYKRPRIVNPAFAKRSVEENVTFKEKLKIKIDRMKMHERQSKRGFLKKEHLDDSSVEFHRNSRAELYRKIEALITVLGGDGRQCVLYKLCESAQASRRQGTFQQEFLRVVFTLPKGQEFDQDEHKDYDKAHVYKEDCSALYPGCNDFQMNL